MPVNLSVRPRRRRGSRILWLAGTGLLLGSLVIWQRGWWSTRALADLGEELVQQTPLPASSFPQLPTQSSDNAAVVLATSTVVESPDSDAFTAELYTGQQEGIPWPNAGGRTRVETDSTPIQGQ